MFGLIPKEEKFFLLFKEMTTNIIEGAKLLKDMLDDFENPAESQRKIKDVEHKGDSITHEIIQKLNKTFITPLDREDIYALAAKLDDIIDLIDASAARIIMYNIESIPAYAKSLGFIILQSCQAVDKAVAMLGKRPTTRFSQPASRSMPWKTRPTGFPAKRSAGCSTMRRIRSS